MLNMKEVVASFIYACLQQPGEYNTIIMRQIHSMLSYHFLWGFLSSGVPVLQTKASVRLFASCCPDSGHLLTVVCYSLG